MRKRIAFVGGVHGVGKTVFCNKLSKIFEFDHVTASNLISRRQHLLSRDKTVNNIDKNQLILKQELANYRTAKHIILLDGHFCLLDSSSNIQNVPLDIFKALSPYVIVLLIDKASIIAVRLSKRDGREYSLEQISILQERELKWAHLVSTALNVPIKIIDLSLDYEDSISNISLFLQNRGR